MDRRKVLIGAGALAALGGLGGLGWLSASVSGLFEDRPLALVYRGPAACSGCAEAVAALLRDSPSRFRTEFCGPQEERWVTPSTLGEAVVYAQPGGGEVGRAWRKMRDGADDIRNFVHNGGSYLGFCLGAYLAGSSPGFGFLRGAIDRYIDSPDASVQTADDTIVNVRWRGQPRRMYFQDGPLFRIDRGAPAAVLATYDNGTAAAVVASYGAGRVGLVGPHPEADRSWYSDTGLSNPDGIRFDLGYDLIESTVHEDRRTG